MIKRVHIAVGLAASTGAACLLQEMQFDNPLLYVGATAIAGIASILPDIDINAKSNLKKGFKLVCGIAALFVVLAVVYGLFFNKLQELATMFLQSKTLLSLFAFLVVCLIGYNSPHRTFTHWLIGALAFSAPLYFLIGYKLALWFFVGFVSHQLIDMLNKQKITWLYPLKLNCSRYWCASDSTASTIIGCTSTILTPIFMLNIIL